MADDEKKLRLEIAHILFIDIVGYSKLLVDEQHEQIQRLNEIVRATDEFRSAEAKSALIRLPTGDGMALVFLTDPEAPVQCAVEIAKALKSDPRLQLRMGIHSGPVNQVSDVNERANVAGAGMNMAQRVMDCGDAGHILLSKRSADDLSQYRQWQPHLHDLGQCQIKHGSVHLYNFFDENFGNPAVPSKIRGKQLIRRATGSSKKWLTIVATVVVLALLLGVGLFKFRRPLTTANVPPSSSNSSKSIAVLPFIDMSQAKDQEYFCDGISEELLDALAKVG
ncbi:MAG: adenylate/guanylate cyclase domain-containing protein, partial [Chthoniobacterales bacterium]